MSEAQTTETGELDEKPKSRSVITPILIIIVLIFSFITGFMVGPRIAPRYETKIVHVYHTITMTKYLKDTATLIRIQKSTITITALYTPIQPKLSFEYNVSLLSLLPVVVINYSTNIDLKLIFKDPNNSVIDTKLALAPRGSTFFILSLPCRSPYNGTYTVHVYDVLGRYLGKIEIPIRVAKPIIDDVSIFIKNRHNIVLLLKLTVLNNSTAPIFITKINVSINNTKIGYERSLCLGIPPKSVVSIGPLDIHAGNLRSGQYNVVIALYTDWGAKTMLSLPIVIP